MEYGQARYVTTPAKAATPKMTMKKGGAYCFVLLQKWGVNSPQPLLPFGAIVIFEFHDASVEGRTTILAPA
jgi:hypothetical protein